MTDGTSSGGNDPQTVIDELRAISARFRAEGAALAAARATRGSADDGLTSITVDLNGDIVAISFSAALATSTPTRLATSVEQVYTEAIQVADERLGEEGPPEVAPPASARPASAQPADAADLTTVLERLAAVGQWGTSGVLARSPYADAELDRDPARFNDVVAAKVSRAAAAYADAQAALAQVVGHAESDTTIVETDPSGGVASIRFTAAAPRTEPEELAADVLGTLTAARDDAERQRAALLADDAGR